MTRRKGRSALIGALVAVAAAVFAQGAQASITPSISLDQSGGTQAGASQNLGMDLKFDGSSLPPISDTPDDLTINLPPGLLANASVDGGACLTTTDLSDTNCQVGTGSVTAYAAGLVPLTVDVTFDLVPPPAGGDLAGLAVNENGTQIGQTGDIKVRPSGDPNGVGVTIGLVLPNNLYGAPIDISDIDSTFDGLRYPTTCPSTPANVSVSANSYSSSTVHTITAPLRVTGCSSLPYAPKLSVFAVKDSADRVVKVRTGVTQAATESPTKNLTLAFPDAALGVNLAAVKLLCLNLANACTPVGTATAVSPLYPKPLTANAYLTGTALGPDLTLVFPAPFPLTLTGTVTLTTKTAAFTGLPDIPLTSLSLVLNGGPNGMFLTNCNPGAGVADGTSTDQNGDRTVSASVKYSISGCPASSHSGSGSSSKPGSSGGGSGKGSDSGSGTNSPATVTSPALVGLKTGHPSLSFKVSVGKHASKLKELSVKLTPGMSFVSHRVGKRNKITGVKLAGAQIRSLSIARGRLLIKLRRPERSFSVTLTSVLRENNALTAAAASGKTVRLSMTLTSINTRNKSHTLRKTIKL